MKRRVGPKGGGDGTRDAEVIETLRAWFAGAARELPWRREPRSAWGALVSEIMLQQTQVARVGERFEAFLARFPTPAALAAADEHEVLAAWAGLGYYRRARLLWAAARAIGERHGGRTPVTVKDLAALPGVGRYTAGAVASIVGGEVAPIVDGNVARVLMRLENKSGHAGERGVIAWAWDRAEQLARAAGPGTERVGAFNEAMMELGAVICTPRQPRCLHCPIAERCAARAAGTQDRVPAPKPAGARRTITAISLVFRTRAGEVLLEQRPERGLWAKMWQPPTCEQDGDVGDDGAEVYAAVRAAIRRLGLPAALATKARAVATWTRFTHTTTHRDVRFIVVKVGVGTAVRLPGHKTERRWVSGAEVEALALSNAAKRALGEA